MNIEIANRLQKLRKEKGYSQEQLAEALGISRQAVSKWERAESSPDTDNLICLAKLYGISLDELLSTDQTVSEIVESNEKEELPIEKKKKTKAKKIVEALQSVVVLSIVIAYFLIGFLLDLWHPGWILFIMIPVGTSLIDAVAEKDMSEFAYPVFLTALYLFFGCVYDLWSVMWVIFITVPIYYSIESIFEKKDKVEVYDDDNEDEE